MRYASLAHHFTLQTTTILHRTAVTSTGCCEHHSQLCLTVARHHHRLHETSTVPITVRTLLHYSSFFSVALDWAFSALTLLVGRWKGIRPVNN